MERPGNDRVMVQARDIRVDCGACGREAFPDRVLAFVKQPQQQAVKQYAIVEYACSTSGCVTFTLEVYV